MSARKIAIVMPELLPMPPVEGGAVELWVDEVLKRIPDGAWSVSIISRPAGIAPGPHRYRGVPWTRLEARVKRLRDNLRASHPLRQLLKIQNVWSYGRRAINGLSEYDVVCIQNEPNLLAMLSKRPGQRVILHMHNDHLTPRIFRLFYRRALAKADEVICVSEYIRKRAVDAFPEFEHKFSTLLNGADVDKFLPGHDSPPVAMADLWNRLEGRQVITYAGRIVANKGVHVLMNAFSTIAAQRPDAMLVIAGSSFFHGAKRSVYQDELARSAAHLADRIVFTGFLAHADLKYLYSRSDIVAVPSTWGEPCPLTVLEGMASGSTVLASRTGGIPELIEDGVTGVLALPGDVNAWAAQIVALLNDSDRREAIGLAARSAAESFFNWERVARDFQSSIEAAG